MPALMLPPAPESRSPKIGPREKAMGWLGLSLEEAERLLIEQALTATGYNISEAARQLGVTRMAMRYRMRKHGLDKSPDDGGGGGGDAGSAAPDSDNNLLCTSMMRIQVRAA